jgi:hypothetical protein
LYQFQGALPLVFVECVRRFKLLPRSNFRPLIISADLAETLGVLLGDGCVCRYFARGRYLFVVAFTGSPAEYSYYEKFIRPTFESCFGVRGYLYRRRDNTTRYHVYGTKVALALASLGVPIGKKRDAAIPPSVLESGQVVPFIRGIYHAEGSIYRRYSKRYNRHIRIYSNLLTIQIRMKLSTLMHEIRDEFMRLGIVTNRLTHKDGVYTLRITSQVMITKFLDLIRPRYKTSPRQTSL